MSEPGGIETTPDPADVPSPKVHPAVAGLLAHFDYGHLQGADLHRVASHIHEVAHDMADRLSGPELTVGLRKLLEAKDCFVRAAVEARRR